MKKQFVLAVALLLGFNTLNAQTTGNKQKTTNKTTTTNSGNTSTGTQGNQSGSQGNHNMGASDTSGTLYSTGRYAAMGARPGSLHRKDMKFVMVAHSSNTLELALSRLALEKSTNQAVRDFATMMVTHHTMAAQQMKQLLGSKGAMIPDSALLSRHQTRLDLMQGLSGAEFDRTYARFMVDEHEEDVDEFEDETTDARDADLRAFATKMLPTLQTHYTRAKELRSQLR